jgi:hypothetical protein
MRPIFGGDVSMANDLSAVLVAGAFADAVEEATGTCAALKMEGSLILRTRGAGAGSFDGTGCCCEAIEVFASIELVPTELLALALIFDNDGY